MRSRKFYGILLFVAGVLFVFVAAVAAQSGDLYQYIEPTMDPSYPKPGDKALVEQTVNGITVRIINLRKEYEYREFWSEKDQKNIFDDRLVITLDACYSTPDSGEWFLYGEVDMLQYGDKKSVGWFGSDNWWNEKIADGKSMGEKCSQYKFSFDKNTKIEPPLIFTFDRMFATPREGQGPCEELMKRVETNPRAQEAGLKIGCENVPNAREDFTISVHDATPVVTGYDRSVLTKQEAHALMLEIQDATVYGPWIFKITPTN